MGKYKIHIGKEEAFLFLVELLILGQVFQYFTRLTHIPTFWPSVLGIVVFTIVFNYKILLRDSVVVGLVLYVILILNNLSGHLNHVPPVVLSPFGIFSMVFQYVIIALVIENLIVIARFSPLIVFRLGRFSFYIILLTVFVNFVSEILFPGITRDPFSPKYPSWVWGMSFGTFYSIPFLFLIIVNFYRRSTTLLCLITALFIAMILRAGFLTALALMLAASLIGLLYRLKVKRKFLLFAVLFAVLYLLLTNMGFIMKALPQLPNPIYQQKAEEVAKLQGSSNASDLISGSREGVYDQTLETIKDNFVFGSGDYDLIGQHSFWLDKLGFLGIVGVLGYFLILLTMYKAAKAYLNAEQLYTYNTVIVMVAVFLFMNPIEWPDFWLILFVMIPSMLVFLTKSESGILRKFLS